MNVIKRLADRGPFIFVLVALGIWVGLAGLVTVSAASLLRVPVIDPFPQRTGALVATLLLVARLGWLEEIGITGIGGWSAWVLALFLAGYILLSGSYAFFGEAAFDPRSLFVIPEARTILVNQAIVGFAEETLFRGILLYALVRTWGSTRWGLLAAVLIQAGMFAVLHALALIAGSPLSVVGLAVAYNFIVGLWLGALVLHVKSLWPAIFLHGAGNAAMFIQALTTPWVDSATAYPLTMLFELPLALIGLWILLRARPAPGAVFSNDGGDRLGSPARERLPGW